MSLNPFGVRRATPADVDALMLFVPQVLAETTLLPLSKTKVEILIERCAYQRGGAMAGIIDGENGQIDASVGLCFTENETSDEAFISAAWCGLHPNIRKMPSNEGNPRAHYGKKLFEFAKWCHGELEKASGKSILMRFDLTTKSDLSPKIGLYQRNLTQVGAAFAFSSGNFVSYDQVKAILSTFDYIQDEDWRESVTFVRQSHETKGASIKLRRALLSLQEREFATLMGMLSIHRGGDMKDQEVLAA